MSSIYLLDERFLPKDEVKISPDDRGYYFGDGYYEVFRVYSGKLYEPEAHFARLIRTSQGVRIPLPYDVAELHDKLKELISLNSLIEGTVYLQITRGYAPRALPFPAPARPTLHAYTKQLNRPLASMEAGIRAATAEDIRWLHCDYKTLNLLGNALAKQDALDSGADEAILHRSGSVTECSASNVMIVRDGTVVTHPADNLILHGVTRAVVFRLAQAAEISVEERRFTVEELLSADEVFITGTTVEITPVINVDGQAIGNGSPGPITRRLQRDFASTIE